MSVPRITPGSRRDVGVLTWAFAQVAGRVTGTTPPNIFLTLGRHRSLFRGWLVFAGRLMPGGTLPRRESELVILRVARLADSAYERTQHRRLGARAGLTDVEMDRVELGPQAPGWSPRERALLLATDELHHTRDLGDETWELLRGHLDERGLIELVMLAGHYELLATALHVLRVQPDRPRR